MKGERPFYRVFHMTKREAAIQQIEAAISAFHAGQFAVAITLAGAADGIGPAKAGGIWETVRDNPNRPIADRKKWIARLNGTRDWLKHDQEEPTRNLVAFEVGLAIIRAMDKWEPWSPAMVEFKHLWFNSPKLLQPDDYD
jgi:hypothetical protein